MLHPGTSCAHANPVPPKCTQTLPVAGNAAESQKDADNCAAVAGPGEQLQPGSTSQQQATHARFSAPERFARTGRRRSARLL